MRPARQVYQGLLELNPSDLVDHGGPPTSISGIIRVEPQRYEDFLYHLGKYIRDY